MRISGCAQTKILWLALTARLDSPTAVRTTVMPFNADFGVVQPCLQLQGKVIIDFLPRKRQIDELKATVVPT